MARSTRKECIPHVSLALLTVLGGTISAMAPVSADAVSDFYSGKTITIQVGTGPGGGYDTTTRIVARYFGKHVPGNPNVIVQNVPGSGGLHNANAIYNTASRDGLTLGVFSSNVALEPLYGNKQARFNSEKFAWIGSMDSSIQACGVWNGGGAGIKKFADFVAAKKTISFGSTSATGGTSLYPLFMKNALGAPVKVVNGYKSTKEIQLAMSRGEVDANCGLHKATLLGAFRKDYESGNLNVFVQLGVGRREPFFGDVADIMSLMKTDELRQLANFVFGPALLSRPLMAPPDTPADRVNALRKALLDTIKDPELVATTSKMDVAFVPIGGEEVQKMIEELNRTPPELVKKAYQFTRTE